MTPETVINIGKEAIALTIMLSLPMLGLGLIVGLIVSIFQAVTSIQEMTLMFVPKIIAVFLGLIFFAPWILEKITTYTINLFNSIPMYIR